MNYGILFLLAAIQGFAELLPVSSSAHVIAAQKLLGLDPAAPEMTLLLVALHTGTMFAVIVYFWKRWRSYFTEAPKRKTFLKNVVVATAATGVLGLGLKIIIEKIIFEKYLGHSKGEIEELFRILPMVGGALLIAGIFNLLAGLRKTASRGPLNTKDSLIIGLIQGVVLPFRGLSRSGMTISGGMLLGKDRHELEDFSFALAVVLTPAVIALELKRFLASTGGHLGEMASFQPALVGMVFSFFCGLAALKWLSSWLEKGRWYLFGIYCVVFACFVLSLGWFLPA